MKRIAWVIAITWSAPITLALMLMVAPAAKADPSKYPEFVQQTLPADVTPEFVGIDQLVADIKGGGKPVLLDVRTKEEFDEVHILGAQSVPLGEFKTYVKSIPRDRPVVLY
jgi:Rhodanese-like domain